MLLSAMSGGMVRPSDLILWFMPILGGFTASVWIVRATSLTFPALARRGLFCIPEEVEPPEVVRRLALWHDRFRVMLPDVGDARHAIGAVLRDADFYRRHRRETRPRAQIAEALLPRIRAGAGLRKDDLMRALGERQCFEALYQRCSTAAPA
jgi:membrane glycosyltransferase